MLRRTLRAVRMTNARHAVVYVYAVRAAPTALSGPGAAFWASRAAPQRANAVIAQRSEGTGCSDRRRGRAGWLGVAGSGGLEAVAVEVYQIPTVDAGARTLRASPIWLAHASAAAIHHWHR